MGSPPCQPNAALAHLRRREEEEISRNDSQSVALHLYGLSRLYAPCDWLLYLEMLQEEKGKASG
jgi:hypothetical protein